MNTPRFTFSDSNQLIAHLQQGLELNPTGVWHFYQQPSESETPSEAGVVEATDSVYLGVTQGRFIYANPKSTLSWAACVDTLQRSLSKLRSASARQKILQLENSVSPEQQALLGSMLNKLVGMRLLDYEEARTAFRAGIVIALEQLAHWTQGCAEFTPNYELVASAPIQGFELSILTTELERRQAKWQQLRATVPSMEAIPVLNADVLLTAKLPAQQKEQLITLLAQHQSLRQLAVRLGKDPLVVASTFSGLIRQQLVSLQHADIQVSSASESDPCVFVVDDSPLLIRQFVKLVTHWGYRVQHSNDAMAAVEAIAEACPDVIFLDINMPGATGFDLIKQIRRMPEIASTPVVLLTAENSVSNKWRAQWANCKFLAKPATTTDVSGFRDELQAILQEVAPKTDEQAEEQAKSPSQPLNMQQLGHPPSNQLGATHLMPSSIASAVD